MPEAGAAKSALRERHLARRRGRPAGERDAPRPRVTDRAPAGPGRRPGLRRLRAGARPSPATAVPAAFTQLGARVLLPVVPLAGSRAGLGGGHRPADARAASGCSSRSAPGWAPRPIGTADVVVVPALAVDRDGVRLGRGGGYYDRALRHARADAVLVAVVFDDELVDELPAEPHDRRVHRGRDAVRRLAGATPRH